MSGLLDTLVRALQAQAARSRGFLSDAMAHALARVAVETIRQHERGGAAGNEDHRESGEEMWEPTGELRWFTERPDQPLKLQQAYRALGSGEVAWRDVPLVLGQPRA